MELDGAALKEKAERFEQQVEDWFIDPDGLVYNCINYPRRRPYRADDFSPADYYRDIWKEQGWPTIEAFANYENTPANTGAYLAYQSYRYQVTGDSVCLERAERTLRAIKRNFEIGEKALERGYWPKPFSGLSQARRSKDMTPDCNFNLVLGLNKYLDVAPPALQDQTAEILKAIIDFYVKHNFDHSPLLEKGYRGLFDYINTYHYHAGPILICYVKIAADRFGPEPYQGIYEKLLHVDNPYFNSRFETQVQMQQRLGDAYWASPAPEYHRFPPHVKRELGIITIGGAWSGVSEAIGYLARHDTERTDLFRTQAEHWFKEELEPSYAGDGWGYLRVTYDYRSKKVLLTPPDLLEAIANEMIASTGPHKGFSSVMRDGLLSASIWALATMALHLANPEIGAGDFTKRLLLELDEPSLCVFNAAQAGKWPPGFEWLKTQYQGVLYWLHTYYCGKFHGTW